MTEDQQAALAKAVRVNGNREAFASYDTPGLTKREYMATALMVGMLTNGFMPTRYGKGGMADGTWSYEAAAIEAADALLAELYR